MPHSLELLGILSAFFALAAFIGNQYGVLDKDDIKYDALNMLSGIGLVIYAISIGATPFIITNTVWATVSGVDVAKYFWKRTRAVNSQK